jgi:hypothetical protein
MRYLIALNYERKTLKKKKKEYDGIMGKFKSKNS